MSDLAALRKRVEEATGADFDLDVEFMRLAGRIEDRWDNTVDVVRTYIDDQYVGSEGQWKWPGGDAQMPHPTASVDAALALVEQMLPGLHVGMVKQIDGSGSAVITRSNGRSYICAAKALPLAILAALLAALETKGP